MITIDSLKVAYGRHVVIKDLSAHMPQGQVHGSVGLNGAGKTTLLNAIFGLLRVSGGEVKWKEQPANRKTMAYLPTEPFFYPNITGREYLSIFPGRHFELEKWNALFKLPLDQLIESYSTGMKKKLALLGVIKPGKEVVILDEPFSGLDLESVRILREVLIELALRGKTILVTSHILETLTNLCDRLYYLADGNFKAVAQKSDFVNFEEKIFENIQHKNQSALDDLFNN